MVSVSSVVPTGVIRGVRVVRGADQARSVVSVWSGVLTNGGPWCPWGPCGPWCRPAWQAWSVLSVVVVRGVRGRWSQLSMVEPGLSDDGLRGPWC